jgi:hypothetical protein
MKKMEGNTPGKLKKSLLAITFSPAFAPWGGHLSPFNGCDGTATGGREARGQEQHVVAQASAWEWEVHGRPRLRCAWCSKDLFVRKVPEYARCMG